MSGVSPLGVVPLGSLPSSGSTPSLIDLNFRTMASNDALDAGITLVRGSSGVRINSSGLYETETGDNPRFMFDPVSLASRGLLIERASENFLSNPIDISNASWVKSGLTVTANDGTAPDGTNNGDLLTKSASGDAYVYATFTSANNEDWTISAIVKPNSLTTGRLWIQFFGGASGLVAASFNMVGPGEVVAVGTSGGPTIRYARIEAAPSGYYRLIVSGTNDASGNTLGLLVYRPGLADGDTGTQWMFHGQAEKLARHTSPILSTTTRSAEKCRYLGDLLLPCWFIVEWETTAPSMGLRYTAIANDGDLSDFIAIAQSLDVPSTDIGATHTYSGSVDQGVIGFGTWDPYGREIHRVAVKVSTNDYVVLSNRGDRATDTSISQPTSLNEIWLGGRWDTVTGQNDDVLCRLRSVSSSILEPEILSIVRPEHKALLMMGVG